MGASGPSINRMTEPNLMRLVGRAREEPPSFPRLLTTNPFAFNWVKICSRNLIGSFSFAASSLTWRRGLPSSAAMPRSMRARNAYSPRLESFMSRDPDRAGCSNYHAWRPKLKRRSGFRRPPRIGKKPAHQHFSSRAPEGPPPCHMTSRADKVKTVLVLIADGGAAGRLGQDGDQNKGAKNDFRGESWKHSGCNHAAHCQKQKRFHHVPS